ncbi:MAG: hypothetical protein AAF567_00060 [Actinomycetota bacterium]
MVESRTLTSSGAASATDGVGDAGPELDSSGANDTNDTDDAARGADGDGADGSPEGLPTIGPAPGSSHWHAAYVVRICDDVIAPFTSDADPLGIHSHADGLIHIHPFFVESGFEQATLGLFADAMGLALSTGRLRLPGGGVWRDGDLCNGEPGRVFVDRWVGPDPTSEVERIFDDPELVRFEADREIYQIAFAPAESPPVVPPSWVSLDDVSIPLTAPPEPWVLVDPTADPDSVSIWTVDGVTGGPCDDGQVPESVRVGEPGCYEPGAARFDRAEAIEGARAVEFNRQPAVELRITPTFRNFIVSQFIGDSPAVDDGLVLAIEVDGAVATAPLLTRPSVSEDRLVIAGGLSITSAQDLATVLGG